MRFPLPVGIRRVEESEPLINRLPHLLRYRCPALACNFSEFQTDITRKGDYESHAVSHVSAMYHYAITFSCSCDITVHSYLRNHVLLPVRRRLPVRYPR